MSNGSLNQHEVEVEAKVVMVDYMCHSCGNAVVLEQRHSMDTNYIEGMLKNPQYKHKCPTCERKYDLPFAYPRVTFRAIK